MNAMAAEPSLAPRQARMPCANVEVSEGLRVKRAVGRLWKVLILPDTEKRTISFAPGAKEHLDVVAGLPNINSAADDLQITDICMFVGSAACYAKFFEASLAEFLVNYRRSAERIHLDSDIQTLEETLHKKTMGALLTELRKLFMIDDVEIDSLLSNAFKGRNFLMHELFRARKLDFPSKLKRQRIFEELIEIGLTLKKARFAVRGMTAGIQRYLQVDDQ